MGHGGTRLTGGTWNGRPVLTPSLKHVRPTLSRVRTSIFGILQHSLKGSHILDAYAGSGALGFEALSRGAADVVFIDTDRRCLQTIARTATTLDVLDRCQCVHGDVHVWLSHQKDALSDFTCAFMDPPYHTVDIEELVALCGHGPIPMVIVEHADDETMRELIPPYTRVRQVDFGQTVVSFYLLNSQR